MDPVPTPREDIDMDAFRREIEALKASDPDIHLPDVNVSDLTEFDAVTWRRFVAGALTVPEFNERRHEAVGPLTREHSRNQFYAYIGNSWYDRYPPNV